jgi:Putative Actinobacterial Holin-X, holin superfamily III
VPTGSTQEISKAIADITERAQVLVRDEIELAKLEVTGKVKTIGRGAGIGIAAGVFIFYAIGLILVGLSLLAWYLLPSVPDTAYFWGFFLVAGVLIVIAGLAGWFAARALQTKPTPDMAIEEAQRIRDTIVPHDHPGGPGGAGGAGTPGGPIITGGPAGFAVPAGVSVPPGTPGPPAPGTPPPPTPVTPPPPTEPPPPAEPPPTDPPPPTDGAA